MAGTLTVDTIQSDSSYASTLNVASKINFTSGMQIGGQDTTFGGMRNRIINGDMRIDQRNAGASQTPASTGVAYTTDRWYVYNRLIASKYSVQQLTSNPPSGYTNYLGVTSLSAYSVASGDIFYISQVIEGYNIADLGWGTASAKPITLSFWVQSSLTGQHAGSIQNSGSARSYPFIYTINSANTWEQKSITIPGDTSGTWGTTNGNGLQLTFNLGTGTSFQGTASAWSGLNNQFMATGSVQIVGTNGATFYITGVQLEKGSVASAFEQLHYGHSLALCQRYYTRYQAPSNDYAITTGYTYNSGLGWAGGVITPVPMRSTPSLSNIGSGIKLYGLPNGGYNITSVDSITWSAYSCWVSMNITIASAMTNNAVVVLTNNAGYGGFALSAEL